MSKHRSHEEKERPAVAVEDRETPEGESALPGDPRIIELEQALQKATDERDQLQEQLLRSVADFQNFRKRAQQDAAALRKFANESLVADILPAMDNFERTIAALAAGASTESIVNGIRAIERQLASILETHNVSKIKAHGQPFDPELHEAIGHEDSDDHPEGTVVAEVEPGYRMSEKVIRPARVRVSKSK